MDEHIPKIDLKEAMKYDPLVGKEEDKDPYKGD